MPAASEPTSARMIICALLVLIFAASVWFYIERRSAPPPVPKIEYPGGAPR